MKIAVTYQMGQIFQHFGHTSQFKIYEVNGDTVVSAKVVDTVDVGTHYIFIAEVEEAEVLSDNPSATYSYYHKNIKPKPEVKKSEKTRWVCKICGYVYEGDELPEDFICPICKHPASDFEKV